MTQADNLIRNRKRLLDEANYAYKEIGDNMGYFNNSTTNLNIYNYKSKPNRTANTRYLKGTHANYKKANNSIGKMLLFLTGSVFVIRKVLEQLNMLDKKHIDLQGSWQTSHLDGSYQVIDNITMYEGKDNTSIIKNKIILEAKKQGVDPALALAMAQKESNFRQYDSKGNLLKPPKYKNDPDSPVGVFQIKPSSAKEVGYTNIQDIDNNISAGIAYIKKMLKLSKGDVTAALASYNWGRGNYLKYGLSRAPLETRNYVSRIQNNRRIYEAQLYNNTSSSNSSINISNAYKTSNGITYNKNSNIRSNTLLKSNYNQYYNPNVHTDTKMGMFMNKVITSGIGYRDVERGSSFHKGLDLRYAYGAPVYAFCSGKVTVATNTSKGYGRTVIITDSNGYKHRYSHLSAIHVSKNKKVKKGDLIGNAGGSNYVNGRIIEDYYPPHLHYGIYRKGSYNEDGYIDPRTYVYPSEYEQQNSQQNFNNNKVINNANKLTYIQRNIKTDIEEKDSYKHNFNVDNIYIKDVNNKISSAYIDKGISYNQLYHNIIEQEYKDHISSIV